MNIRFKTHPSRFCFNCCNVSWFKTRQNTKQAFFDRNFQLSRNDMKFGYVFDEVSSQSWVFTKKHNLQTYWQISDKQLFFKNLIDKSGLLAISFRLFSTSLQFSSTSTMIRNKKCFSRVYSWLAKIWDCKYVYVMYQA